MVTLGVTHRETHTERGREELVVKNHLHCKKLDT